MNKIVTLLTVVFLLVGCAPSENQIQTAIVLSDIAKPTNTILPTNTLKPTETTSPRPTPQPTPNIPVRQLVIKLKDISDILPGLYITEIMELDLGSSFTSDPDIIESYTGFFKPERGAGNISLSLLKFKSESLCNNVNTIVKPSLNGKELTLPSIKLPVGTYALERTQENDIFLSFCLSNIQAVFMFEIPQGVTASDYVMVAAVFAQRQYSKFIDY